MEYVHDKHVLESLLELAVIDNPEPLWQALISFLRVYMPHRFAVLRWNNDRMTFPANKRLSLRDTGNNDLSLGDIYSRLNLPLISECRYLDPEIFRTLGLREDELLSESRCVSATTIFVDYDPVSSGGSFNTMGLELQVIPSRIDIVLYHAEQDLVSAPNFKIDEIVPRLTQILRQFLARSAIGTLTGSIESCLRDVPIGLVFLDSHLNVVFANREGIRQSYLWKNAPNGRLKSNLREEFELPDDILHILQGLYSEWADKEHDVTRGRTDLTVMNERDATMKAVISRAIDMSNPLHAPNYFVRFLSMNSRRVDTIVAPTSSQLSVLTELTAAERSVAAMVMQGLTNQQIAEKLHRQTSTVKDHLTNIYAKLGINSRLQLLRLLSAIPL